MHLLSLNPHADNQGSVITIGNFDGLHLGHQQLIKAVQDEAMQQNAVSAVILFEPQPLEFFSPNTAPLRLMSLGEKLYHLRALGVQRVGIVRFNQTVAMQSAESFVVDYLVNKLNVKGVWVGDDFRFGVKRSGDITLMRQLGEKYHFSVRQSASHHLQNRRVSSTWLREVLLQGDMDAAKVLLGEAYRIRGRVAHGQKIGRTLGFPTMNIVFKQQPAASGVFVVEISGLAETSLYGVANVGKRPTISGHQYRLEVYVFDWSGDAYGKHVSVSLHHRLREEQCFTGLAELKNQIKKDVSLARDWLGRCFFN